MLRVVRYSIKTEIVSQSSVERTAVVVAVMAGSRTVITSVFASIKSFFVLTENVLGSCIVVAIVQQRHTVGRDLTFRQVHVINLRILKLSTSSPSRSANSWTLVSYALHAALHSGVH
jgi:type IV secretory pathway VirB3-like protein